MSSKDFFEAGKTYIENEPYRAPEVTAVFMVVWLGTLPGTDTVFAFGFTTPAFPGDKWEVYLTTKPEDEDEGPFEHEWLEAVWDDGQKVHFWRPKSPGEVSNKPEHGSEGS